MTQQQLLQNARGVLVGMTDAQRQCLKTAAIAAGRKAEAVSKASTMRLALWVSKGTSAIWVSGTVGPHQAPPTIYTKQVNHRHHHDYPIWDCSFYFR